MLLVTTTMMILLVLLLRLLMLLLLWLLHLFIGIDLLALSRGSLRALTWC